MVYCVPGKYRKMTHRLTKLSRLATFLGDVGIEMAKTQRANTQIYCNN